MSQSPGVDSSQDDLDEYLNNWRAVNMMVRHGSSFSGNERHCVYLNTEGPRFANISSATGLDFPDDGRGMASVDWDSDGDLDFWFFNRTSPRLRLMLNQSAAASKSVSFLLSGTQCNRDAIGARVEVVAAGEERPQLATLYAGDGFVSQSSKWLHFGLGEAAALERVSVRWPDGSVEDFAGVEPGHRYVLTQGAGTAAVWERPSGDLALHTEPGPAFEPTQVARVYLPVRFPQPLLDYTSLDGREVKRVEHGGAPRLVNFWASWCAPCVAELGEFTAREEELRKAGLDILSLSVDGFGGPDTTAADASAKLQELGFPFETGLVSLELLDKIEMIESFLFDRIEEFVVPISYLFDARGELAVIYRGRVDVDVLLADLERLDVSLEERHALAVPFPGEWRKTFNEFILERVAQWFSGLYPEDTARYLEMQRSLAADAGQSAQSPKSMLMFARSLLEQNRAEEGEQELRKLIGAYPEFAEAHTALGEHLVQTRRFDDAIAAFGAAIEIDPSFSAPYYQLGLLYGGLRQPEPAVRNFQKFVELAPDSAPGHNNLGSAYQSNGNLEGALAEFELAAELDPAYAPAQVNIARIHSMAGRTAAAVTHFEKALEIDPTSLSAVRPLVWILATHRDANVRDGARAVEIAESAALQTGNRDMGILGGLAVSYAEVGRFDEAVGKAREALQLAQAAKNPNAIQACQQWIQLFSNSQPYRE